MKIVSYGTRGAEQPGVLIGEEIVPLAPALGSVAEFAAVTPLVAEVLGTAQPDAGFYLWAKTPIADTDFARGLLEHYNVVVLPGSFLARESDGVNPGAGFVRIALVASLEECLEAAERIRAFCRSL